MTNQGTDQAEAPAARDATADDRRDPYARPGQLSDLELLPRRFEMHAEDTRTQLDLLGIKIGDLQAAADEHRRGLDEIRRVLLLLAGERGQSEATPVRDIRERVRERAKEARDARKGGGSRTQPIARVMKSSGARTKAGGIK